MAYRKEARLRVAVGDDFPARSPTFAENVASGAIATVIGGLLLWKIISAIEARFSNDDSESNRSHVEQPLPAQRVQSLPSIHTVPNSDPSGAEKIRNVSAGNPHPDGNP